MNLFFSNNVFTGRRFEQQELDHGEVVAGTSYTTFTFNASYQPLTAQEMLMLEEGKRTRINYKLITVTELNLATQTTKADWVQIDGMWFEVSQKSPWKNGVLPHYEYFVTKIENPKDYE